MKKSLKIIKCKIVKLYSSTREKIIDISGGDIVKMDYWRFFRKYALTPICLVLVGCMIFIYTTNRDKSVVKICESSIDYNKGIGLTFHVGKDGKTVEIIEKNDTVSLDFIKKNLTDENSKKILTEYKKNAKFFYEDTMKKYKGIPWFTAEIEENDNMIKAIYKFNVADKSFDYDKYKNLLEEFSLQYYYDINEKKFIYDEEVYLSKNTPLGNIENVTCTSGKELVVDKKLD